MGNSIFDVMGGNSALSANQQQPQGGGMPFQDFIQAYRTDPKKLHPSFTGNPMQDTMLIMQQRGIGNDVLQSVQSMVQQAFQRIDAR